MAKPGKEVLGKMKSEISRKPKMERKSRQHPMPVRDGAKLSEE
jgi:hypothetical protein